MTLASPADIYQLLFPAIGLLLLGIWIWWTGKYSDTMTSPSNSPVGGGGGGMEHVSGDGRTSVVLTSSGNRSRNLEALEHVVLEGRRRDSLTIQKAYTPWRVLYPLHLLNSSYSQIDIIGYSVTVLWDDTPTPVVKWAAPDADASNGMSLRADGAPVDAIVIEPYAPYKLNIPVNLDQIVINALGSPKWSARGTITFRIGTEERVDSFSFLQDYYQLSNTDWVQCIARHFG